MSISLMSIAAALAGLMGVAIVVIGAHYLLAPEAAAATFGLPDRPTGRNAAWLRVKGVRDIVCGVLGLALLAAGLWRELGWFLLIVALVPLGDALIVLRHAGSKGVALGMHGGTAAALVAIGVVLLVG